MKPAFALTASLSMLAGSMVAGACVSPALAQSEPVSKLAGRAAGAPLSTRALPAAPSVHKLSIGPLSAPVGESTATEMTESSTDDLALRARLGSPDANYQLGLKYLSGEGVTRDLVEAFAHIRVAAEAGHPRAISLFYALGAKLTAEEHGQAFERSKGLRQVRDAAPARERAAEADANKPLTAR
jgi:TPR repeat protein